MLADDPVDFCDLRGDRICGALQRLKYGPEKIWVSAVEKRDDELIFEGILTPPLKFVDGHKRFDVDYHVAPVVETDDGSALVMDVAFFDGPVTTQQWTDAFSTSAPQVVCNPNNMIYPQFAITGPDVLNVEQAFCNGVSYCPSPLLRTFSDASRYVQRRFIQQYPRKPEERIPSEWLANNAV